MRAVTYGRLDDRSLMADTFLFFCFVLVLFRKEVRGGGGVTWRLTDKCERLFLARKIVLHSLSYASLSIHNIPDSNDTWIE